MFGKGAESRELARDVVVLAFPKTAAIKFIIGRCGL